MSKRKMPRIQAPYNFVPLSRHVVLPEELGRELQDRPVADEVYSGTLQIKIDTHTPVFIGAGRASAGVAPYKHPDGRFAIPGASLRGMLRNVVEIASFGHLRERVNDHRYGFRDLHNRDLYLKHMATLANVGPNKNSVPYPLSCAGMLRPLSHKEQQDNPRAAAAIDVRSFAKVHYSELLKYAATNNVDNYALGQMESAPAKYKRWQEKGLKLEDLPFEFTCGVEHGESIKGHRRQGAWGTAEIHPTGGTLGRLVMTGQPSKWSKNTQKEGVAGNAKQHDFLFFGSHGTLYVDQKVMDGFAFIHSDRGQQNRLTDQPNEELRYLLREFAGSTSLHEFLQSNQPKRMIPVFFLVEKGDSNTKVKALGLAMMFRLPYRFTVGETIARHQGLQSNELPKEDDVVDRLFGYVPLSTKNTNTERRDAHKGRVWFSDARPIHGVTESQRVQAVLAGPKASYYPSYVQQGTAPDDRPANKDAYRTWDDAKAVPRGWKRYPPRKHPNNTPYISSKVKNIDRVATTFTPWKADKGLTATLRFHNLAIHELGALVWALNFGEYEGARHTLGMAKALGFGQVELSVQRGSIRTTKDWGTAVTGPGVFSLLCECRAAFESWMEARLATMGEVGGWRHSRSIFELLVNSRPQDPGDRHMRIHHPTYGNEFISGKKQGFILAPTGRQNRWCRDLQDANKRRSASAKRAREQAEVRALGDLRDTNSTSAIRIQQWAKQYSTSDAVDRLRKWIGFPGKYDFDMGVLGAFDPEKSDLLEGAVSYLMEHKGLKKMGRVAEPVQSRVRDFHEMATNTSAMPSQSQPLRGDLKFPNWSNYKEKKLQKERSKWVTRINAQSWDDEICQQVVKFLKEWGSPKGQVQAFLKAQAAHRKLTLEELEAKIGPSD